MEKERKGLFGRLMAFWTEKIRMVGEDRIGFWHETAFSEEHRAEMGAVAALNQRETRKVFAEEMAEILPQREEPAVLVGKKRKEIGAEAENISERKEHTTIFKAERFREMREEATDENRMRSVFLWEMPEEEGEKRSIVPVAENMVRKEEPPFVEEAVRGKGEKVKTEKKQPKSAVDVEELMREMTRRLWEEREGCGRRLR